MKPQRQTLLFSGPVQGVGFRMTAVRLAQGALLSGTVRNLPTGEVELIVDGAPDDIDNLAEQLCEHFGARMRTVENRPAAPSAVTGLRVIY